MKALALLLALLALVTTQSANGRRINGKNGWYIPHANGSFIWMSMGRVNKKMELYRTIKPRADSKSISYKLYTRSQIQDLRPIKASIKKTDYDSALETRIIIHGWNQNYLTPRVAAMAKAWVSKRNYNVIVVDWRDSESMLYFPSVLAVPGVGKRIAKMIMFLSNNFQLNLKNLTIIGNSLGAQVAGFVGKALGNGRVRNIVALDAAAPLFDEDNENDRISAQDAAYVEGIHTNAGHYGLVKPFGHSDFYPNGGEIQPNTKDKALSHNRAVDYYVEAVRNDCYSTVLCKSLIGALEKSCGKKRSKVRMGSISNDLHIRGIYYVPVNAKEPYGELCSTKTIKIKRKKSRIAKKLQKRKRNKRRRN
ncbi:phospholipase A1 VesT1.02-like [Scaptodrosophila lebanonensis]|uniref:Phospholipase A1 VesT1.02-like n=1 Tax=Drosophila lebanonensis TaxID=7225 RepID=A0A6J2U3V3_DROLE|nr:phospholipase A1 VesT1.02-like [Scaptodrosophila lebanonensis]